MREVSSSSGNAAGSAAANVAANVSQLDAVDAAALRTRVERAVADTYGIEREIGRGGMAVVYAARDLRLRRTVALKVLPPDLAFRADVRARFVREAQTAAGLNHPNIVPIYAVDERDGMVFFAMSLIDGETLAARLVREPRPPLPFVASVLMQVADALAYAHTTGVVHRDIKPDNILIDRETGRATVTDFGIARALEGGSRLTLTGIAVGTPAFMSPEQATGDREIDGRSDVYSLGIVGYLMLAGRLPFEASSTPAMLVKHVTEQPRSLREYSPNVPAPLVAVIERCLAKQPDDRWPTAAALRDAIRDAVANPDGPAPAARTRQSAPPPPAPPPPPLPKTEDEWRRQYALGKRAEDWRPPLAPLAPIPAAGSRRDFREWRREVRAQHAEAKEQWKEEQKAVARGQGLSPTDAQFALLGPERMLRRFRGEVLRNGVLLAGLAVINANTSHFPWVIFPAFGITMSLVGRYSRLREQGLSLAEIVAGEPAKAPVPIPGADNPTSRPALVAKAVQAWRRHARWAAIYGGLSAGSFVIGASLDADPMIAPFVLAGLASLYHGARAFIWDRRHLNRLGITLREAFNGEWKAKAVPVDTRPRDVRLRERAEQLVGASVLASSMGGAVRSAVEDHATIKETSSKLSDADRVLVPDVDPTADALLERISAIAASLERLERDLPGDAMQDLAARIAAVEQEAATAPDRERRLSLLARQQTSLQDLVARRETLQRQLESASMALRSLRLDMVKLSALGMGALSDVTNATQEARALSKDIARALEAADEVRKL